MSTLLDRIPASTLRRVAIILAVIAVSLFVWGLSFYFRDFPTSPDVVGGRVYPLNNHGHVTYLTRGEWINKRIAPLLAVAVLFVGSYLDRAARSR